MVTFSGDVPPLVSHSAHPEHALQLVATGGTLFQCDGCMQMGDDERRYRCEKCDFDLHTCCALPSAGFEHPMFEGRALTFFRRRDLCPGTQRGGTAWCDVCGNQVLGFLYHNLEYNLDIHPPCAVLPERIVEDDGRVLDLHRAAGHTCGLCGQVGHRGRYLSYRLRDDDGELAYLHVACMMEDIVYSSNGGGQVAPEPNSAATTTPMRRTGSSSSFRRLCQVGVQAARVGEAVADMDPVGMFATMDPDGFFG